MMKASNGLADGLRRHSNHRVARVPRTICSGLGPKKNSNQSLMETDREAIFFVLRAKGKELMLKMFDLDPKEQAKLADLKKGRKTGKDQKSKERSRQIHKFVKGQLTSGRTIVYAYRDTNSGSWVKTTAAEAE